MKVLFWADHFYPNIGGLQVIALPVIHALRNRGHEIIVVTTRNDPALPAWVEHEGIRIRRFDFWHTLEAADPRAVMHARQDLRHFLAEFAPDVIHLFGVGPTAFFYLSTLTRSSPPMLVTLQTEDSRWLGRVGHESILYRVLETADYVLSVTQIEVDRLAEMMPSLRTRIRCLHNALPMPALPPAPLPKHPTLMTLGRLSPEKSFDLAVRAFALAVASYPKARLQIVGDGEERPKLEQLANTQGVADKVDFIGWVMPPQIPAQINQTTAVVLSSETEGLPLAGIEAAQMARPLIAPRVGGLPELVLDGETGLLTEPRDAADMARAMQEIFASISRAAEMGRAARRHLEANFNFGTIISTYDDLYRHLPAQRRNATGIIDALPQVGN